MTENTINYDKKCKCETTEERTRRQKLGFYTSPEEIENKTHIEDNMDYLRSAASMHFDMFEEVSKLCEDFDEERYEEISREYRERHEILEKKRVEGELKDGEKFTSTYFFDNYKLTPEERTVVMQLFGMIGIGIQPSDKCISGNEIMLTLKMIHGTSMKNAWMILSKFSKLAYCSIVERNRFYKGSGVEGSEYTISELTIAQLLDFDEHRNENSRVWKAIMNSEPSMAFREEEGDEKEETEEEKDLGPLEKIDSKICFKNDVILPEGIKEDIQGVITQVQNKEKFESWGMNKLLGEHTGVTMLYSGASGTGKTLTARAIGNLLSKDTYYLSFPKLLSHWYSKTEQNVGKLFDIINSLDGVLVLDEADGLLNKRFESRGCADATENRIVTIFLKELERSSAIIVLTTNISGIMDKALDRRIDLKLEFPMPNEEARERIWYAHLPEKLPLADDVDIPFLAKRYEFSGGQIKNSVVSAVRYALSRDADEVTQEDFVKACEKEIEGTRAMDYSISDDSEKMIRGYS